MDVIAQCPALFIPHCSNELASSPSTLHSPSHYQYLCLWNSAASRLAGHPDQGSSKNGKT